MILIPWQVRIVINSLLLTSPFIYLANNPNIIYKGAEKKNRVLRKLKFENVGLVENPVFSVEQAKKIYQELGFEEEI